MKTKIKKILAHEILDSRGNPTVEAQVFLEDGTTAIAAVPSGASTGEKEALELRDNDKNRFHGKGVLGACKNIKEKIAPELLGFDAKEQELIDSRMIELDGTKNKSALGANAILAVSLATCRAAAIAQKKPLWQHIVDLYQFEKPDKFPKLMLNVINGGAHADSGLDIQEYMYVIGGQATFFDRVRAGSELYHSLKKYLKENNYRTAIGDEGGFAPHMESNEQPLKILNNILKQSPHDNGKIKLGMDLAASEFYNKEKNTYDFSLDVQSLDGSEFVDTLENWIKKYPIELLEDPFDQNDWNNWENLTKKIGEKVSIIGDDLLVTNPDFVNQAAEQKSCNAVLIKVNQIGSLSETIKCIKTSRKHQMKISVSHRSGETTDDFIADLAYASSADYVKFGAPARGDRVVKYNRLIQIEESIKK